MTKTKGKRGKCSAKLQTVKVRIAVALSEDDPHWWIATGRSNQTDQTSKNQIGFVGAHFVWVEAEVPLPSVVTVQGDVSK